MTLYSRGLNIYKDNSGTHPLSAETESKSCFNHTKDKAGEIPACRCNTIREILLLEESDPSIYLAISFDE